MANKEGGHSFECWGARRKLGDWEFKNAHRLKELTDFGRSWHAVLKKDVENAKKDCPVCKQVPKNGK